MPFVVRAETWRVIPSPVTTDRGIVDVSPDGSLRVRLWESDGSHDAPSGPPRCAPLAKHASRAVGSAGRWLRWETAPRSRRSRTCAPSTFPVRFTSRRRDTIVRGMSSSPWRWPLPTVPLAVPVAPSPAAFAALRRHDVHTGIDLHCEPGARICAVERGTVVAIEHFTGPAAGSPWWLDTWAVLVEGASGVVLYGELDPLVHVGSRIEPGMHVGDARTVLRRDKGRPTTMLHLELYEPGARASVVWALGAPRPPSLCDPTAPLMSAQR